MEVEERAEGGFIDERGKTYLSTTAQHSRTCTQQLHGHLPLLLTKKSCHGLQRRKTERTKDMEHKTPARILPKGGIKG